MNVIVLLQLIFGRTKIRNNSQKNIFVKDEDSDNVYSIGAGATAVNTDGLKVDKNVYKVVQGVHVYVNDDNKLRYTSLTGMLINNLLAGGKLKRIPGKKWNKLFHAEEDI